MKQLDIVHHKFIGLVIILVVLITGIIFGVRISGATGTDGMLILLFGMVFLIVVMEFITFTQLLHVRDELKRRKRR